MTATTVTDRIEKTVILKAPRSRIWRALSDATQFGEWFKVKLDGQFKAGATIHGTITYPGYEGLKLEMAIERIEPSGCSPIAGIPAIRRGSTAQSR